MEERGTKRRDEQKGERNRTEIETERREKQKGEGGRAVFFFPLRQMHYKKPTQSPRKAHAKDHVVGGRYIQMTRGGGDGGDGGGGWCESMRGDWLCLLRTRKTSRITQRVSFFFCQLNLIVCCLSPS